MKVVRSGEMRILVGQYESFVTEKGRVAVPKKFREILGTDLIVSRWYEGCLVLVSRPEFENLLSKVGFNAKYATKPVRDTDRFILSSAFEVVLDKQGRFVVPKLLRQFANLANETVFLGLGDRIEIWDKTKWVAKEVDIAKEASEILESSVANRQNNEN